MGIYLKVPAVKGDADAAEHKGWIKLDSFAFGSGREVRTPIGRVADRHANRGQVGEIQLTKEMDSSSLHLFAATCVGGGETMEIEVTRAGDKKKKTEIPYLKYKLEHALFTGYSFHSSGANPYETLSLNFTKITMAYHPQDAALKGEPANAETFDQMTGAKGH